jgi:cytidylate kinase
MSNHEKLNGKRLKIAIDGPAGAGKSTVARMVAEKLGYLYIDTGAMYRAATLIVLEKKLPIGAANEIGKAVRSASIELASASESNDGRPHVFVDGRDVTDEIRTRAISNHVSAVSALLEVREVLVEKQKQMAAGGAVVLDGRDIGTIVMPNAELKIFLTASPEERARRRLIDLEKAGEKVSMEVLLKEIVERDYKDSHRAIAPLRKAEDAILLATDNMTIDSEVEEIIRLAVKSLP